MSNAYLQDYAIQGLSNQEKEVYEEMVVKTEFQGIGQKTTICLLTLRNGHEIVGKAHCKNPEDYNIEIGADFALQDAVDELMKLWAYDQRNKESQQA